MLFTAAAVSDDLLHHLFEGDNVTRADYERAAAWGTQLLLPCSLLAGRPNLFSAQLTKERLFQPRLAAEDALAGVGFCSVRQASAASSEPLTLTDSSVCTVVMAFDSDALTIGARAKLEAAHPVVASYADLGNGEPMCQWSGESPPAYPLTFPSWFYSEAAADRVLQENKDVVLLFTVETRATSVRGSTPTTVALPAEEATVPLTTGSKVDYLLASLSTVNAVDGAAVTRFVTGGITSLGFPFCTSVLGGSEARVQASQWGQSLFVQRLWGRPDNGTTALSQDVRRHVACSASFRAAASGGTQHSLELFVNGEKVAATEFASPDAVSKPSLAVVKEATPALTSLQTAGGAAVEVRSATASAETSFGVLADSPSSLNMPKYAAAFAQQATTRKFWGEDTTPATPVCAAAGPGLDSYNDTDTAKVVQTATLPACDVKGGWFPVENERDCASAAQQLGLVYTGATRVDIATLSKELAAFWGAAPDTPHGCLYRPQPPMQGLWWFVLPPEYHPEVKPGVLGLSSGVRAATAAEWVICLAKSPILERANNQDDGTSFKNSAGFGALLAGLVGLCLVLTYCRYVQKDAGSRFLTSHFGPLDDEDSVHESDKEFFCTVNGCTDGLSGGPFRARTADRIQRHVHFRHVKRGLCQHGAIAGHCAACTGEDDKTLIAASGAPPMRSPALTTAPHPAMHNPLHNFGAPPGPPVEDDTRSVDLT